LINREETVPISVVGIHDSESSPYCTRWTVWSKEENIFSVRCV